MAMDKRTHFDFVWIAYECDDSKQTPKTNLKATSKQVAEISNSRSKNVSDEISILSQNTYIIRVIRDWR